MARGTVPLVHLSAAAEEEGAGDPHSKASRYDRGATSSLPLKGASSFLQDEGFGGPSCHIHPPPMKRRIRLTSVGDRSTRRSTEEGTLSPVLWAPPQRHPRGSQFSRLALPQQPGTQASDLAGGGDEGV